MYTSTMLDVYINITAWPHNSALTSALNMRAEFRAESWERPGLWSPEVSQIVTDVSRDSKPPQPKGPGGITECHYGIVHISVPMYVG